MPAPEPVAETEPEWTCPQEGCDRPLSAHLVSQAEQILRDAPTFRFGRPGVGPATGGR